MREELKAGNRGIFSRKLHQALDAALAARQQAILFLNRRGTNSFVMCRDCGLVLSCPRCDMPLTYHRPGMMLVCHYCGRKEPQRERCPRCDSHRIKYFGLGTEEVERLVTIPIEAAINGVSRIETLRSSSVPGLSVVTAIFEEGTNVLDARQLTAERLAQLGPELPEGVESPRMTPLAASTSRLLMLALTQFRCASIPGRNRLWL